MVLVSVAVLGSIVLAVGTLTAIGSRRRGAGVLLATLAGLCFPVTWVVWYLRDQHPYRRAHSQPQASQGERTGTRNLDR